MIQDRLVEWVRVMEDRNSSPSAASIDSQKNKVAICCIKEYSLSNCIINS